MKLLMPFITAVVCFFHPLSASAQSKEIYEQAFSFIGSKIENINYNFLMNGPFGEFWKDDFCDNNMVDQVVDIFEKMNKLTPFDNNRMVCQTIAVGDELLMSIKLKDQLIAVNSLSLTKTPSTSGGSFNLLSYGIGLDAFNQAFASTFVRFAFADQKLLEIESFYDEVEWSLSVTFQFQEDNVYDPQCLFVSVTPENRELQRALFERQLAGTDHLGHPLIVFQKTPTDNCRADSGNNEVNIVDAEMFIGVAALLTDDYFSGIGH